MTETEVLCTRIRCILSIDKSKSKHNSTRKISLQNGDKFGSRIHNCDHKHLLWVRIQGFALGMSMVSI